jgi:hypothetical protein
MLNNERASRPAGDIVCRPRTSALLAGLLAVGLAGGAASQDVVAELSLEAPDAQQFMLRGTLPLPRGILLAGDTASPLTILQPDGTPTLTQAEIVSRYPSAKDGADVVEVMARVTRPPSASPGERISYEVVLLPQSPSDFVTHDGVDELLNTPGALELSTTDVFGHRYVADLGQALGAPGVRLRRDGPLVREFAVHRVMLPENPVSGNQGTLPHMMGVHAWLRTFERDGFALLDLHVHNGLDGRDSTDPDDDVLNDIYFRQLELSLPPAWRVLYSFDTPVSGPPVQAGALMDHRLVRPRGNSVYLMPRQGRMVRRIAIALPGWEDQARATLEERGLGFARRGFSPTGEALWSWWNPITTRYFPQRHRLPNLDHVGLAQVQADLAQDLAVYKAQLASGATGTYPFRSGLLGWAQPWGVGYGGMTGGDEINQWDGLRTATAGSREGYRLAQLTTRAYSDRQPTAFYGTSGRHTRVQDILEVGGNGPYAVGNFYIRPSTGFGFENAPTFQTEAVFAQGLDERWHGAFQQYSPIDLQHYVRLTRNLKSLTWLGNDTLARHLLLAAADVYHLSFHRYAVGAWYWVPGTGLLTHIERVTDDPGEGVGLGRADAWGLDCASAAYSVADDDWRAENLNWFETVADVVEQGQSNCTGNLQAINIGKLLGGRFLVRRANESGYLEHALVGINESVFRGEQTSRADELDQVIVASARAGLLAPFWSRDDLAVHWTVGVAPRDPMYPEFCKDIPDSGFEQQDYFTNEHSWGSIAYAYRISGDPFFLKRAAELSEGDAWDFLHANGLKLLQSRAAILALVQSLGHQ